MKHTLYSSVRGDGDLSSEIICFDCLIEGKTRGDTDSDLQFELRSRDGVEWQRIENPDPIKLCQICGAKPIDLASLKINQPMMDFINSISTGAYLHGHA